MTPERWQLTQDLLEQALVMPEAERADFLGRSCDGDEPLREELEALLVIDTNLGDFIEKPLFDLHGDRGGLSSGDQLGAWRIVEEIGRGGMGAVYLAERADSEYEKRAAVKLLKRGMDTDELVRRFRSERQILARLDHPHIARLLDGGSTPDGRPYLVMEYVDGQPIDAWCTEHIASVEDRLVLFEKVCRAVHFAHRNLVVHRDLKPGNILVVADGAPRLLDFGIAKLLEGDAEPFATVAAFLPMTPEYASPEQIRGEPVTTATDVYSLGVLLYRLLAGRSPYRPTVEVRAALAEAVCNQVPQRPSTVVGARAKEAAEKEADRSERDRHLAKRLRGDLDTIVQKALAKEPARRYESAEQLAADIRRHLDGLPVLARPSGVGYRTRKFVTRHKVGVAFAAAALIAIIATAAWALVQREVAVQERNRAENEKERAEWVSDFLTDFFEINDPSESRGKEIRAIDLLENARKSLATREDLPEAQPRIVAALARAYGQLGQYETARGLYQRASEPKGNREGPIEAEAILGLAQIESELGNDREANELMEQGLALRDRPGAIENTEYVEALNNYGGLLLHSRKYSEADRFFNRALQVKQEPGRSKNKSVAIALAGLADVQRHQKMYKEAEALYRQSLDLRRKEFGEPSIEVARTLNSLASVLEPLDRNEEAEKLYLQSIAMRKVVLGPTHPKNAPPLSNLARLYETTGQWNKAESPYREAVSICEKSGNEDRNCGVFLSHLAAFLAERKGCGEAEGLAEKAISLLEVKSGSQEAMAESHGVIGGCRAERQDFASAEPLLLQALGELPKSPTPIVERRIREHLVNLYQAMGKPDLAERYRVAASQPQA